MGSTILIAGAGQLGSRYLQGLATIKRPLNIYVQDVSAESLKQSGLRWNEVSGNDTPHKVSYIQDFKSLPSKIDVTIISTTADVRTEVVKNVSDNAEVNYWILEKVLVQRISDIQIIKDLISDSGGAWINTPRRAMNWHKSIRSEIFQKGKIQMEVSGGLWGLACNSVHFIDYLQWLTGESLISIETNRLQKKWFESKRPGFFEIAGGIKALFSGGSIGLLSSEKEKEGMLIKISQGSGIWSINEVSGVARRSDGLEITGQLNFQSQLTGGLIESLLDTGACDLPDFNESAELHRVFLASMLEHWNETEKERADKLPIT